MEGTMTRKQYSARFKAKVAMEAMRGGKPMNELASRFGLHPTQIAQWKKQALGGVPEIFPKHGRQLMGPGDPALSIRRQCALLRVARSGLYYRPVEEREENLELLRLLDE